MNEITFRLFHVLGDGEMHYELRFAGVMF